MALGHEPEVLRATGLGRLRRRGGPLSSRAVGMLPTMGRKGLLQRKDLQVHIHIYIYIYTYHIQTMYVYLFICLHTEKYQPMRIWTGMYVQLCKPIFISSGGRFCPPRFIIETKAEAKDPTLLCLSPTRELAVQVENEAHKFGSSTHMARAVVSVREAA